MRSRVARGTLLALVVACVLPAAPAQAAEFTMETVASYVVDPTAGEVAVSVEVTFTNTLPDPPGQISAFSHVDLAIQAGAAQVTAEDETGALHVDVSTQAGGQIASVRTRSRVRYNQSVTFSVAYRLPDAAAPDLYVRPGVVKFPAWGFGTSSQVTVRLPVGYEVRADGDPMVFDTDAAGVRLTSGPISDPAGWLALVTAALPADYVSQSASVALQSGTVDLQVLAWRGDRAWGDRTLSLLVRALPLLESAIGLPYPRVGPLVVSESVAGEAGEGLPTTTAEIQAAFDGSDFTLLHQAAHIWISGELAADRWIREGLASHYAARVASELDIERPYDPAERATALIADARPLTDWPMAVSSGVADAYGYAASWTLVDRIATTAGQGQLALALARVVAGLSAYDPAAPDSVGTEGRPYLALDTRRFLDQLEAVSDARLSDLFGATAFGPDEATELAQRSTARAAYQSLLADAGDWGAPDPVRAAMSEWRFADAVAGIDEAVDWLADRNQLIAACAEAGLVPPGRLRDQYVVGGGGAESSAELDAERALVDAYTEIRGRATAATGPLEAVGRFLAEDPEALLAEAAEQFGQGDLGSAAAALNRLELALDRAPANGAVRLAGATVVFVLVGVGAGVARWRRSGSNYTAAP